MSSDEPVVRARGLTMSYGDHEAVRGIDLDVGAGECLAFLGPNGAGKTTTVEILEGYRRRTGGEVTVLGVDPAHAEADWRARVGVVLQSPGSERYLSVRETVELYAGYYAAPRPVDEVLALVGLEDRPDLQGRKLSGGQQRRLDVAIALVGDPDLVFLDEPTTGFDPAARRQAWKVISGLRALGKTIFLTTHYLDEAEVLADRIVVIAAGRIVAEGTPQTLGGRDHVASRITFTLPAGIAPEALPVPAELTGDRALVEAERPLEALGVLAAWGAEHGHTLADLEVRRPSLEDTYLELVGAAEVAP